MKNVHMNFSTAILLALMSFCWADIFSQQQVPGQNWEQYNTPEEAGFSSGQLDLAKQHFEATQGAALLVVVDGRVLVSWGDNTRRFMVHSVRKSFMNAMIGREISNGTIDLDAALDQLQIDDIGILTDKEKTATVADLLASRSGVYHPAAYSPSSMIENLPARGSSDPGTHWYYNNWDFNTLLTIYETKSGKQFFEAFEKEIAGPIGMEDFRLDDTFYRLEEDRSEHPAYLFRMSARDMARFGLLYLNGGQWKKNQLVKPDWIQQSTTPITKDLGSFNNKGSYGYLWWISDGFRNKRMYYASGSGGQRIMVMPDDGMVIVHRTDTYENRNVSESSIQELTGLILDARIGPASKKPLLKKYSPKVKEARALYTGSMDQFLGTYRHQFLGQMSVIKNESGYYLSNSVGYFRLYAQSENSFYAEDIDNSAVFEEAPEPEKRFTIEPQFDQNRSITKIVFYY